MLENAFELFYILRKRRSQRGSIDFDLPDGAQIEIEARDGDEFRRVHGLDDHGVLGVLQREGEVVHLLAKRLVDHTPLLGRLPTSSRDFH